MKNSKLIVITSILVLAIGAGLGAVSLRDDKKSNNSQQATTHTTSQHASVDIPKSEIETTFESYTGDDYDRYYMANMIAHHQGAVDMAKLALVHAKHPELKTMANEIITTQTEEIDQMLSWQRDWGYPASNGDMMIDHSAMAMMGSNDNMMTTLNGKTGDEFDKTFLIQMIAHHESAVAMSRPGIKNARHPEVKELTKSIIEAQTREITQMRQWQGQWGY